MRPHLLRVIGYIGLVLLCASRTVLAEQAIEFGFSKDPGSGQETLAARAVYREHGKALRQVLMAFEDYAELHPWITGVTRVQSSPEGTTQFVIQFKFPWPVGQRLSRIEIDTDGDKRVNWYQVEGNMQANRGQLQFDGSGEHIDIDYSAVISVGVPGPWMRVLKRRFVRDFIKAAYTKAAASRTRFMLAGTSAQ